MKLARNSSTSIAGQPPVQLPGKRPYIEMRSLPSIVPALDRQLCTACGLCVEQCLFGAARGADGTDETKCVLCHACVRNCPAGARCFDDPLVTKIAAALSERCRERKEPEVFL